jgi:ankyrin repeat protein
VGCERVYQYNVLSIDELHDIAKMALKFKQSENISTYRELLDMKELWLNKPVQNLTMITENDDLVLKSVYRQNKWIIEINSENKINVVKDDGYITKVLFDAIEQNDYNNFKREFLKLKPSPNSIINQNDEIITDLLINATEKKDYKIVKFLLKYNANPNVFERRNVFSIINRSPLMISANDNTLNITKMLLDAGAEVNESAPYKYISKTNNKGNRALSIASSKGHFELVKLLLENNAEPNLVDANKFLPIYFATEKGYLNIVKILIKYGSVINVESTYGECPLSRAIKKEHIEIVKYLIGEGAHWDRGKDNHKPIDYALRSSNNEIVQLFKMLHKDKLKKKCIKLTSDLILEGYYELGNYYESLTLKKNHTFVLRALFMYTGTWKIDNDEIILEANWAGGMGNMGDEYEINDKFIFGVTNIKDIISERLVLLYVESEMESSLKGGEQYPRKEQVKYF